MKAKNGPAFCILVMGSRGKYDFFPSFISGQRETTRLYCNTGNVTKCGPRKAQILNGLPDGGGDSGDPMRAQN